MVVDEVSRQLFCTIYQNSISREQSPYPDAFDCLLDRNEGDGLESFCEFLSCVGLQDGPHFDVAEFYDILGVDASGADESETSLAEHGIVR